MLKQIDHIGFIVRNLEQALERYERVFKVKATKIIVKENPHRRFAFIPIGEAALEIVEAVPGEEGPGKELEKYGEGFSHIAYRVSNIEEELAAMKKAGVKLRDEKPRIGAEGHPIAFIAREETLNTMTELVQQE